MPSVEKAGQLLIRSDSFCKCRCLQLVLRNDSRAVCGFTEGPTNCLSLQNPNNSVIPASWRSTTRRKDTLGARKKEKRYLLFPIQVLLHALLLYCLSVAGIEGVCVCVQGCNYLFHTAVRSVPCQQASQYQGSTEANSRIWLMSRGQVCNIVIY